MLAQNSVRRAPVQPLVIPLVKLTWYYFGAFGGIS